MAYPFMPHSHLQMPSRRYSTTNWPVLGEVAPKKLGRAVVETKGLRLLSFFAAATRQTGPNVRLRVSGFANLGHRTAFALLHGRQRRHLSTVTMLQAAPDPRGSPLFARRSLIFACDARFIQLAAGTIRRSQPLRRFSWPHEIFWSF